MHLVRRICITLILMNQNETNFSHHYFSFPSGICKGIIHGWSWLHSNNHQLWLYYSMQLCYTSILLILSFFKTAWDIFLSFRHRPVSASTHSFHHRIFWRFLLTWNVKVPSLCSIENPLLYCIKILLLFT